MVKEYFVELDREGCKECMYGYSWRVVKPDDSMHNVTFDDKEDAEDIAEILNEAMEFGKRAVEAGEHPAERRIKIIQAIKPREGGNWRKADLISLGISYPPKPGWLSKYLLGENPNE